jgi:amidase
MKGLCMTEIHNLSAIDLSQKLRSREISAIEVMQATLARIHDVNPKVNAIIALADTQHLIEQAKAADQAKTCGVLHGIPFAVKDLTDVVGLPTSKGSHMFAGHIPAADGLMVTRLRNSGAIFIGKTNTPEFGLGSHTFNPVFGTTKNPYNTLVSAGGSSGGAGAALATRMVALADGSDMMGSLRNPAAWNNIYGFRPTWSLVPSEPEGELFFNELSTPGPMARSPQDLALLLNVQAGLDARLPHGIASKDYLAGINEPLDPTKLGWLGDWSGAYPIEEGIIELCQSALGQMAALDCKVESLEAPFSAAALWESWTVLRSWFVAMAQSATFEKTENRDHMKLELIWEVERGLMMSGADIHRAGVIRSDWYVKAATLFQTVDFLALPSTQVWPFPIDLRYPETINGRAMDTYHRWMEIVIPVSLLGLPCVNIPVGFGANNLPCGMQIFGPRGSDARLLRFAQSWHCATDWPNAVRVNF